MHLNTKHGMTLSSEYTSWARMKDRCANKNANNYQRYGGRGIFVCDRWINSFENFIEDMGNKPGKEFSIDRIDNLAGYCPENCKWSDRIEQCNNRRSSSFLMCNGKTQTIAQWAKEMGYKASTIGMRLSYGWTIERAINTPLYNRGY